MHVRFLISAVLTSGCLPLLASSADGLLEVNQACATNAGCFAGDTGGFPVLISSAGSYRLTSNLAALSDSHTVIQVEADDVSIDLNGFALLGPRTCTEPPVGCTSTNPSGRGIRVFGDFENLRVSNGTIRGFSAGITALSGVRVENVDLIDHSASALFLGSGALVTGCSASRSLGAGIVVGASSTVSGNVVRHNGGSAAIVAAGGSVITGNSVSDNQFRGINCTGVGGKCVFRDNVITGNPSGSILGAQLRATGGNVCDDQLCSSIGSRLYYLTPDPFPPTGAPSACAAGYVMAAASDLATTELWYNRELGASHADMGLGPPRGSGWARTGNTSVTAAGEANCQDWTGTRSDWFGTTVGVSLDGTQASTAWRALRLACSLSARVWCIQD